MTLDEITEKLARHRALLPGKRVKVDFGAEGTVLLDGVAGAVSNADADADTTIGATLTDLQAIREGRLDPMVAYIQGRLRVSGDMANAMELAALLRALDG